MSSDSKRYALVKWLENSQFDANNEWFGRITSVLHTNIIDFDPEELKTGMEINVFRNGEVWRAQVIIPKTTMNTIDLPPSNHKIRAIVMPIKDADLNNLQDTIQKQQSTFQEANDYDGLLDTNTLLQQINDQQQQQSQQHNNSNSTTTSATTKTKQTNNNNNNKEWQFIDNVINDVTALDLFQQSPNNNQQQSTQNIVNTTTTTPTTTPTMNGVRLVAPTSTHNNNNNTGTGGATPTTTANNSRSTIIIHDANNNQQETETCEINFETILQMHCELIDQQKDLRKIELETIEQLKLLQRNVSKLNKKFDLFEQNVLKSSESAQSVKSTKSHLKHLTKNDQFHRRDNNKQHNEHHRVSQIVVDNSNLMNTIACVSTGIDNLTSTPPLTTTTTTNNNINNPLLSSTSYYNMTPTQTTTKHQQQQQQLHEQSPSSASSLYTHHQKHHHHPNQQQQQQQLTTLILQQPPQSTVPQLTIIQHQQPNVTHLQQTPFHDIEIEVKSRHRKSSKKHRFNKTRK